MTAELRAHAPSDVLPAERHGHDHGGHGHSHGRVDESITRPREGLRVVAISLGVLGLTAALQLIVFAITGVVAAGLDVADPLIGLVISLVILHVTWQSWKTISAPDVHRVA
jgi:divalent metal cation (Fe/Co/Zn/Cd) transporter